MKKVLFLVLTLLTVGSPPQQTWTGELRDSTCKFEHESIAEGEPVLPSPECVKACIRGGARYVFIVEEHLYEVENQKNPDLATFGGKPIKLTGELKGNAITVSRIELIPGR